MQRSAAFAFLVTVLAGCSSESQPGLPPDDGDGCPAGLAAGGFTRVSETATSLISQRAKGATAPSLVADSTGAELVVYRDDFPAGKGEIVLRKRPSKDAPFSSAANLSQSAGESSAPSVAARDRRVAVAWVEEDAQGSALLLRVSEDGGSSFGPILSSSRDVGVRARPRVAIDSAGHVVLAWRGASTGAEAKNLWLARSIDAGRSIAEPVGVGSTAGIDDPSLVLGPNGNAFVAWTEPFSFEGGFMVMVVRENEDGSVGSPVSGIGGETIARSELAVDATGSLFLLSPMGTTATGQVHSLGAVLSRSTDQGATFAELGVLETGPISDVRLAVDDAGDVLAAWTACAAPCIMPASAPTRLRRSTDGGATFSAARDITRAVEQGVPLQLAAVTFAGPSIELLWDGPSGWFTDVFVESLVPDGATSELVALSAHGATLARDVGADAKTSAVAVGGSRVLLAWAQEAEATPSEHAGIFFADSHDGGQTFSNARRIAPRLPLIEYPCRRESPELAKASSLPDSWVSIAARGTSDVAIAWADITPDPMPHPCFGRVQTDVFVSRSEDGGATFSEPINVSHSVGLRSNPALAFDGDGSLVLLWEESRPTPKCSNAHPIMATRSEDGGRSFSSPIVASEQVSPAFCGSSTLPSISSAGQSLHVAWLDTDSGSGISNVVVSRSIDGGRSFALRRTAFTASFSEGRIAAMAANVYAPENASIAWRRGSEIFLSRSRGNALSEGVVVARATGVGLGVAPSSADMDWLVWVSRVGQAPGEIQLAEVSTGAAPVSPRAISSDADDSARLGVVTGAKGQALISWQSERGSPGTTGVLFTCRPSARPAP